MKKILLVDNQAHVLRVVKMSLDRNGYDVDAVLCPDVALTLLKEQHYDAVVIDQDMRKMTGQQLIEAVHREYPGNLPLLYLVVTDYDERIEAWANALPYTEMLEKPVSLRWLVSSLNNHFGHYRRTAS